MIQLYFIDIVMVQYQLNLNITGMQHLSSEKEMLPTNQHKILQGKYASIPPGKQSQRITGILTIKISIKYLNSMRESTAFRCKFWGMDGPGLTFQSVSETQKVLNLNITSTLQSTSTYFKDMKGLCIEVLHFHSHQRSGSLEKNKVSNQYKQIGWIFVNPQRYIINFVLNNFQETVSIIDMRKQKIGEAVVKLATEMYRSQDLFPISSEPQLKQPPSLIDLNYGTKEKEISKVIVPKYEPGIAHQEKEIISIKRQPALKQNSNKYQNNHLERPLSHHDQREWIPSFNRKGKAEQFLDEYKQGKPDHTQLSLLRDKYGYNYPSVQAIKLKYDQVRLLSKQTEEHPNDDEPRINLLLTNLRLENKIKIQSLTIYCQGSNNHLRTETKIILSEPLNHKIDINHLYTLPNCSTDLLAFEIKDGRVEVEVKQLCNLHQLDFKNKNNKKIATLEFTTVSAKRLEESKHLKPTNDLIQQRKEKPRQKESGYIYVLNWPADKIILNNKNAGRVSACKLLFQLTDPTKNIVQVILSNQNRDEIRLEAQLSQLFKEQNYLIEGKQVKVISARGNLHQVLTLISKLQPQKMKSDNHHQTKEELGDDKRKEQASQHQDSLKYLTSIFMKLSSSENVECSQLIGLLSNQKDPHPKRLQQLANIIQVSFQTFSQILKTLFGNDFSAFFAHFRTYHSWNHRYLSLQRKISRLFTTTHRKRLMKVISKIKKSNEVLFGVINSPKVLQQFNKMNSSGQSSEVDHQSLSRVIILIFERYFKCSIQISELEEYFSNFTCQSLNSYLLCKLSNQITSQESLRQQLSQQQLQSAQLFKVGRSDWGQEGLAKLLFSSGEELVESSIGSEDSTIRKETQVEEAILIKTQQSRQNNELSKEDEKEHVGQQQDNFNNSNKPEYSEKKVAIVVNKIDNKSEKNIKKLVFIHQKQVVQLSNDQILFPKAVSLLQNQVYKVQVSIGEEQLEGVFIAVPQSQKVQLYLQQQEAGYIHLGPFRKQLSQESEIAFQLITTHKPLQQNQDPPPPPKHQDHDPSTPSHTQSIKSANTKMTIRSIRPSRPSFKLKVSQPNSTQVHWIQYPENNQLIMATSQKGWVIQLLGEEMGEVVVLGEVGSNTYCFTSAIDNRVAYIAIIEIQECWEPTTITNQESLQLYVHLEQLICLKNFQAMNQQFILQHQQEISKITTIGHHSPQKVIPLSGFFSLNRIKDHLIIKLIDPQSQAQIAQFAFTITHTTHSLQRDQRYLISSHSGYRLKISVFQVRHEWTHCRPHRILSLFAPPNKKTIESWVKSNPHTQEQQLITWLRSNFQLTLGQIDIILYQLLKNQPKSWNYFLQIFNPSTYAPLKNIEQLTEEFIIFDWSDTGHISEEKMNFVWRVLDRNFKQISTQLQQLHKQFVTSCKKENNFIIDILSPEDAQFDYLSFLSLFANNYGAQPNQQLLKQGDKKQQDYLQVKIVSFNKLAINGTPCTFLFKIQGQTLAEPIHRCYSHTFSSSEPIIIRRQTALNLQIYCQRLNSQGKWEYRPVETVPLASQVKILGGTIHFLIQSQSPLRIVKGHEKEQLSPIGKRTPLKEQEQLNIDRGGFDKSYWNKSLNQTKQKWAKSNENAESRRKRKVRDVGEQQIKRKMEMFEKEWQ